MADLYEYRCDHCGYEAEVCGKPSMTFMMYLETINCKDCQELHDVVFAQRIDNQESDGRLGHLPKNSPDPVVESLWQQISQECEDAEAAQRPIDLRLCEEIHAAILTRTVMSERDGFQKVAPGCPESEEHSWERWQHPGPCPKCGEILQRGEQTMCVD